MSTISTDHNSTDHNSTGGNFKPKKIRIGDILIKEGFISEEQLDNALAEQKKNGLRLGKTLIKLKYVDENSLLSILAKQLDIPFVDLKIYDYQREAVRTLRETIARRFRVIVLNVDQSEVTLGMSDPTDIFCLDELNKIYKKPIRPVVVRESDLLDILDASYGESEKIASLVEELSEELSEDSLDFDDFSINTDETDAPVVQLIKKIFEEAIKFRASDIHIEPDDKLLRIRYRIDGTLSEQVMNESRIASAVIVRLKLMSGLNISEKRLPQDGRFNLKIDGKTIDVRISTLPIQHDESVVMRLLVVDEAVKTLKDIGMPDNILPHFEGAIKQPHGLILVTGPTGSGKTTTLYAALSDLNTSEKKIITAEDPVEFQLPRLCQVQIKDKIGLDFASVLRSALRQDPDVLLIGEIRDSHSAEIALRAAMTGHLVFSTLHTNDAISSSLRLIDMGVDPFLVASSLRAVVAQRLVRRLCDHCKMDTDNTERYQHLFNDDEDQQHHRFKSASGCPKCFKTGYRGRIAVFEYLQIDDHMSDTLRDKDIRSFSLLARSSKLYSSLKDSALQYAKAGLTSLDEVERVALQSQNSH